MKLAAMLLVKSIETYLWDFYLCFSFLPLKDQLKGLPLFWLPHRVGGKLQGDPGPRRAHQVLLYPMGMRERRVQRASGKFCSPTRVEVLCIDLRSPPTIIGSPGGLRRLRKLSCQKTSKSVRTSHLGTHDFKGVWKKPWSRGRQMLGTLVSKPQPQGHTQWIEMG